MRQASSTDLVHEFHVIFKHPVGAKPTPELIHLRTDLLWEELDELNAELDHTYMTGEIRPNLIKEMADLQYVLSGLAVALGIDLDAATRLVHQSNLTKLGEDGKPIFRADGKVMKGPNYKAPDMTGLVPQYATALPVQP